jgi:segregation and condensation protein B
MGSLKKKRKMKMSEVETPRKRAKKEKKQTAEIIATETESNLEIPVIHELVDESTDVVSEVDIFLSPEEDSEGFLPEASEEVLASSEVEVDLSDAEQADLEGTELAGFESAQIDEVDFIEDERLESIVESILFASDRPVSLASIKEVFKGTNVKKDKLRRVLDQLSVTYASGHRGVQLIEVTGGYQLRTKLDNLEFLKRSVKTRPFKLSGPALEVLSIVAYKQPVVKNEIDQIRGVESGHLLRALMEKGLCAFEGKAETLPGKPMQYGTTRRFLEIFGLRNLKELPSLSQIDELLPEGISTDDEQKPTLASVTDAMSEQVKDVSYSQGEDELGKIENELSEISTSSDFFEQEKVREKKRKEAEKAQDIRDAMIMGEAVSTRDVNWLKKHDEALTLNALGPIANQVIEEPSVEVEVAPTEDSQTAEAESSEIEEDRFLDDAETEDELEFRDEADEGATH